MAASIVPVAKALSLCDYHIGYANGKVDLYGLFNSIRPRNGYPHTRSRFCVFAQLLNGLGEVSFDVDLRYAGTDELIWSSKPRELFFPNRTTTLQVAVTVENCRFEHAGIYVLEFLCNNTWVCDTQLLLR